MTDRRAAMMLETEAGQDSPGLPDDFVLLLEESSLGAHVAQEISIQTPRDVLALFDRHLQPDLFEAEAEGDVDDAMLEVYLSCLPNRTGPGVQIRRPESGGASEAPGPGLSPPQQRDPTRVVRIGVVGAIMAGKTTLLNAFWSRQAEYSQEAGHRLLDLFADYSSQDTKPRGRARPAWEVHLAGAQHHAPDAFSYSAATRVRRDYLGIIGPAWLYTVPVSWGSGHVAEPACSMGTLQTVRQLSDYAHGHQSRQRRDLVAPRGDAQSMPPSFLVTIQNTVWERIRRLGRLLDRARDRVFDRDLRALSPCSVAVVDGNLVAPRRRLSVEHPNQHPCYVLPEVYGYSRFRRWSSSGFRERIAAAFSFHRSHAASGWNTGLLRTLQGILGLDAWRDVRADVARRIVYEGLGTDSPPQEVFRICLIVLDYWDVAEDLAEALTQPALNGSEPGKQPDRSAAITRADTSNRARRRERRGLRQRRRVL